MKRLTLILLVPCLVFSFALVSFAANMQQGTIKGIDTESRTILFCPAGTTDHITMSVGKTVDLTKFKTEMKVKVYVTEQEGKTIVQGMKPDKRKVIQGC